MGFNDIGEDALRAMVKFEGEKNPMDIEDHKLMERVRFKSTLAFAESMKEYASNISDRILHIVDYHFEKHTIPAQWIKERFMAYGNKPLKKMAMVADDIYTRLLTEKTMWEEVPKAKIILKELNRMMVVKNILDI